MGTKTLVHTFVSSRLDYCNALLHGVSERDDASRTIGPERSCATCNWCAAPWSHHVDSVTRFLSCLFQCLSGSALTYLTVDSSLTPARADSARATQRYVLFDVHTTPSAITAGPRLWNSLQHSWTVQTVAEDTSVRGSRRFVTFLVNSAVRWSLELWQRLAALGITGGINVARSTVQFNDALKLLSVTLDASPSFNSM